MADSSPRFQTRSKNRRTIAPLPCSTGIRPVPPRPSADPVTRWTRKAHHARPARALHAGSINASMMQQIQASGYQQPGVRATGRQVAAGGSQAGQRGDTDNRHQRAWTLSYSGGPWERSVPGHGRCRTLWPCFASRGPGVRVPLALRRSWPPVAGSGVELEPGDHGLAGPVGVDLPQRVLVAARGVARRACLVPRGLEQDPPAIG
jgi:hypothetical protein